MKYADTVKARFIRRPNRFIADVLINDHIETVHVKNTGRCSELLLPASDVMLQKSSNPSRKTVYDLISVYKRGIGWVNIDSQVPNLVVKEWLESGESPF
ncbi:MAG: DNA/RNA nuclease SfsA, partial [Parasporobacterium sp.]|nr:DNA/RNA nuclease SfsA [Parasporobacterium sp.]